MNEQSDLLCGISYTFFVLQDMGYINARPWSCESTGRRICLVSAYCPFRVSMNVSVVDRVWFSECNLQNFPPAMDMAYACKSSCVRACVLFTRLKKKLSIVKPYSFNQFSHMHVRVLDCSSHIIRRKCLNLHCFWYKKKSSIEPKNSFIFPTSCYICNMT